mmetsp:Transcript_21647/g.35060  ORF Transcript_21647/g.35060 Transcript_21647/m.35060 type:complete len:199 (-) Transcript_21647:683-1279(-)
MELGDRAAEHISRCKEVRDDEFAMLAGATLEAVLGGSALEDSSAAGIGGWEAEAGIALLVVEAAKGGLSGEDLEALMNEEFDIGAAKAKILADVYALNKSKLTDSLVVHARASPVARLVDVKWRADHIISSSENGASQSNQFHVTWKTTGGAAEHAGLLRDATGGGDEEIKFTCTLEQMQHLTGKLRDACRAAEKYAS